jgi:antitoxin component YwqK of YwqJK toxin-antitoxin module
MIRIVLHIAISIFFVSCGQEDGYTVHYADPDNRFYDGRTGRVSAGHYKDGKREGHWVFYNRNGTKINWEGNFTNGKRNGVFTWWYDGKKSSEIEYYDDKVFGSKKHYYRNGNLSSHQIWGIMGDTSVLKAVRSWKPNGDVCPLTNVKDGTGLFVMYDENGEEEERSVYKNGVLFE